MEQKMFLFEHINDNRDIDIVSSIKKIELRDQYLRKLWTSRGEIIFTAPIEEFETTDWQQTSISVPSDTHTQYLWWSTLVYVWYMATLSAPLLFIWIVRTILYDRHLLGKSFKIYFYLTYNDIST